MTGSPCAGSCGRAGESFLFHDFRLTPVRAPSPASSLITYVAPAAPLRPPFRGCGFPASADRDIPLPFRTGDVDSHRDKRAIDHSARTNTREDVDLAGKRFRESGCVCDGRNSRPARERKRMKLSVRRSLGVAAVAAAAMLGTAVPATAATTSTNGALINRTDCNENSYLEIHNNSGRDTLCFANAGTMPVAIYGVNWVERPEARVHHPSAVELVEPGPHPPDHIDPDPLITKNGRGAPFGAPLSDDFPVARSESAVDRAWQIWSNCLCRTAHARTSAPPPSAGYAGTVAPVGDRRPAYRPPPGSASRVGASSTVPLHPRQLGTLVTAVRRQGADAARRGRAWGLPPEDRVLLVATYCVPT